LLTSVLTGVDRKPRPARSSTFTIRGQVKTAGKTAASLMRVTIQPGAVQSLAARSRMLRWSTMSEPKLEFCFGGGPVGFFQTAEFPREPGVYPYMPYRSGSHYRMHQTLRESGSAECSCVTKDGIMQFKVTGCPGYGRLELCDFKPG
jgi:hypothetical protein